MKYRVKHEFAIRKDGKSAYGAVKDLFETLDRVKELVTNYTSYGYTEDDHNYIIWWSTIEEI
jgi:hypothetical protein